MALAVIYLAAGIAATVRALRSGDGGLWFWCGTLVGGGILVLVGLVAARRHPREGRALICIGCHARHRGHLLDHRDPALRTVRSSS